MTRSKATGCRCCCFWRKGSDHRQRWVLELLQRGEEAGLEVVRYAEQTHSVQLDAAQRLVDDMSEWLGLRTATARREPAQVDDRGKLEKGHMSLADCDCIRRRAGGASL